MLNNRPMHSTDATTAPAPAPWFGPYRRMLQASLVPARSGAQGSGVTTRIAERLLETGAVDAVLDMAPDPNDN